MFLRRWRSLYASCAREQPNTTCRQDLTAIGYLSRLRPLPWRLQEGRFRGRLGRKGYDLPSACPRTRCSRPLARRMSSESRPIWIDKDTWTKKLSTFSSSRANFRIARRDPERLFQNRIRRASVSLARVFRLRHKRDACATGFVKRPVNAPSWNSACPHAGFRPGSGRSARRGCWRPFRACRGPAPGRLRRRRRGRGRSRSRRP